MLSDSMPALRIPFSAGLAAVDPMDAIEPALEHAGRAPYRAKAAGRDRFCAAADAWALAGPRARDSRVNDGKDGPTSAHRAAESTSKVRSQRVPDPGSSVRFRFIHTSRRP